MVKSSKLRCAAVFVFAAAVAVFAHHHDKGDIARATNYAELQSADVEEFGGATVVPMLDVTESAAQATPAVMILAQAETQAAPVVSAGVEETPPPVEKKKRGMEFGGRVALGNTYTIGIDLRTPVSESMRIYYGLDGGYVFGTFGYHAYSIETNVFAEFVHNISKEGDFRFFWGFGGAFGWQGVSGEKPDLIYTTNICNPPESNLNCQPNKAGPFEVDENNVPIIAYYPDKGDNWNFGLGLKFGLETELAFIDPEHSLYKLRDATVSVDFRPMLYFLDVNGLENYPTLVWGIGLSFRWLF